MWSRSTAAIDGFWAGVVRAVGPGAVLGYGDAKFIGRAPNVRIRQSAERAFGRARVVAIDEFRTSATCHVCGDRLQGVVDAHKNHIKGLPAGAVDRGLKRCARSTCSSFLDRDVNVRRLPLGEVARAGLRR